ncbi:hypothetical protein GGH14_006308, partial [Coemansia sp. RSA 370]
CVWAGGTAPRVGKQPGFCKHWAPSVARYGRTCGAGVFKGPRARANPSGGSTVPQNSPNYRVHCSL